LEKIPDHVVPPRQESEPAANSLAKGGRPGDRDAKNQAILWIVCTGPAADIWVEASKLLFDMCVTTIASTIHRYGRDGVLQITRNGLLQRVDLCRTHDFHAPFLGVLRPVLRNSCDRYEFGAPRESPRL
jgi:hypothetical protein